MSFSSTKIYEVVEIRKNHPTQQGGDEYRLYMGIDFEDALAAKENALYDWENLTSYDKALTVIECRVYEADGLICPDDIEALEEAIFESVGYDLF